MTEAIIIHVSPEVARVYQSISQERQRQLEALLSLKLMEALESESTLEEVMNELSRRAQQRGLTPEILESILQEN
ncbi:MAG: hypothetical protein NT075_23645 [Chloroflexi bacterium]|nr:hypothetical protein [Chloroflexota bacterium]